MRRAVELRGVQTYYWSTKALAWGLDTRTGERVAFAVPLDTGASLRQLLETDPMPIVNVSELDILFTTPEADAS